MRVIPAEHEPIRRALIDYAGGSGNLEQAFRALRRDHGRDYPATLDELKAAIDRIREQNATRDASQRQAYVSR